MTRMLLTMGVPLLAPTVLYVFWLAATRRDAFAPGPWTLAWPWLLGSGVALTALTLAVVSVQFGTAPRGTYVPPRVVGGQVQAGHMAPAPRP